MKVMQVLVLVAVGAAGLVGYEVYTSHQAERAAALAQQETTRARPRAPAGEPAWGASSVSTPTAPPSASQPTEPAWTPAPAAAAPARVAGGGFTCDGRTHCSQMTSCAEAEFFLRNCPNTQMDGNNDGEPCERQWCK